MNPAPVVFRLATPQEMKLMLQGSAPKPARKPKQQREAATTR